MSYSAEDLREVQAALGLTNRDLQSIFDVSDQTVVNWRQGHTPVPRAVSISLSFMCRHVLSRESDTAPD